MSSEQAKAVSARLGQMLKMLEASPGDAFLLYGVALELKKAGDLPAALEYLGKTVAADPNYLYAYYQQGQVLEQLEKVDEAREAYSAGLKRAEAAGDQKAAGELRSARDLLD